MKRFIVLSLLIAGTLLAAGFSTPAHTQTAGADLKPTFISPTPGLYVHGWPPFSVSYPKEWVEMPLTPGASFRAGGPRPDRPPGVYSPIISISVFPILLPMEDWAKVFMPFWTQMSTDIKVLSDKPSQLKDGTPAREVEFEAVVTKDPRVGSLKSGIKMNTFILITKKESAWISIVLIGDEGRIEEDLKRYVHSMAFLPGREEPVNVPPDVRAFLDMYCTDIVSHNVEGIMAHFSDRFLDSGMKKTFIEQTFQNGSNSAAQQGVTSFEATVTLFEAHGDKAYVDGFFLEKTKDGVNTTKRPMSYQQIINENGQWKWYGNHK